MMSDKLGFYRRTERQARAKRRMLIMKLHLQYRVPGQWRADVNTDK